MTNRLIVTLLTSASLLPLLAQARISAAAPAKGNSPGYLCRAVGDSLTAGYTDKVTGVHSYPAILQTLGQCGVVVNDGVSGQTSTQVAVRVGALPTTATISGGAIPASGPVGITFKPGYEPASTSTTIGVPIRISGVAGTVTHERGVNVFRRSTPGAEVPSSPDSPVTIDQGPLNKGFVIIWAGKNNALTPDQVVADVAAIVASLPSPKHFVVLSVTNSDMTAQWNNGSLFKRYMAINSALAAAYPDNYLDIRSILVAAYNPRNPEDVIDHSHDVIPSSLRLASTSTLAAPIPDATSCTAIPAGLNSGTSVQIDKEKVYILLGRGGFGLPDGCIRGYAGTTATTHAVGAPVITLDHTHINPAGQAVVAQAINAWIIAHPQKLRGAATADAVNSSPALH